jgi:hypothetical protein
MICLTYQPFALHYGRGELLALILGRSSELSTREAIEAYSRLLSWNKGVEVENVILVLSKGIDVSHRMEVEAFRKKTVSSEWLSIRSLYLNGKVSEEVRKTTKEQLLIVIDDYAWAQFYIEIQSYTPQADDCI